MLKSSCWGRLATAAALAAALAGCGADDEDPPIAPGDRVTKAGDRFDPDAAASGPRVWVEATLEGGRAHVEVWAAELGPVFGYAAHLEFDPTHLALEGTPQSDVDVLAPGDSAAAMHLWNGDAGDLAFGATRRTPALGEVEIQAPVRLGSVTLRATAAKRSRIAPARVIVRRADATYVPAAATGGTMTTAGAS